MKTQGHWKFSRNFVQVVILFGYPILVNIFCKLYLYHSTFVDLAEIKLFSDLSKNSVIYGCLKNIYQREKGPKPPK